MKCEFRSEGKCKLTNSECAEGSRLEKHCLLVDRDDTVKGDKKIKKEG
jgi:hypothetical protein